MQELAPTPAPSRERAATVVEYVGLGALSTLLVSGAASALGSGVGERLGAKVVSRLVEVISTGS